MRNKPRILIVEDETITSYHIQRSLQRLGYEVAGIATGGASALQLCEQTDPDLLLADVGLDGDMDGIEVAIRAREQYGIPSVFLTAYSDSDTMRRARVSEPYGFLVKPFAEQELQATIEIALQQDAIRTAQEQEITASSKILTRTQEELAALTERLFSIQEQEREEIARDLHDDFGQRLAMLHVTLENLWEQLPKASLNAVETERRKVYGLVEGLSNDLRNISHRLHPSILDHLGLAVALRDLAESFEKTYYLPVRVSLRKVPDGISLRTSLALYRIVQEALQNISKHAGPDATVIIALIGSPKSLHLTVRDTGRGIDPAHRPHSRGLGLVSIVQRAAIVGGRASIDSVPGEGTRVSVSVPLKLAEGPAEVTSKKAEYGDGMGPGAST